MDVLSRCSDKSSLGPVWFAAHTFWILSQLFLGVSAWTPDNQVFPCRVFSKWEVKYARDLASVPIAGICVCDSLAFLVIASIFNHPAFRSLITRQLSSDKCSVMASLYIYIG